MKDRIKKLRMTLNMTQAQFGEMLGVGRGVIVNIELGRAQLKKLLAGHVCEVFAVDPHWLQTGEGRMFIDTDEHVIEPLGRKYGLSEKDKQIIRTFVRLEPEKRAALAALLENLSQAVGKGN